MSISSISRDLRKQVIAADGDRCSYCSLQQYGQGAAFHIDHVEPRAAGGPTSFENLAVQRPHCSLRKSNKISGRDPVTGDAQPIFHPRRERWIEHFVLRSDGTCRGITPTGRATVDALQMNARLLVDARIEQLKLGLLIASEGPP